MLGAACREFQSLAALILAVLISTTVIADGESTWFEDVQLIEVYALLGLVFYYASELRQAMALKRQGAFAST